MKYKHLPNKVKNMLAQVVHNSAMLKNCFNGNA